MSALLKGVAAHATRDTMETHLPTASTLARCLFDDVPAAVGIYDAHTLVPLAMNGAARAWAETDVSPDQNGIAGRTTDSLWNHVPDALREDHRAAVTEALQTGRPIRLIGMVRGRWSQTVYRPAALEDGSAGLVCVCAPISEGSTLADDGVATRRSADDDMGPLSGLTERELEVLRLIGMGMTSDQIARELHRSAKTVQGHRNALGLKLGVENRVALARIAIRAGLTALSSESVVELGRRSRRANRRAAVEVQARPFSAH